MEVTVTRTDEAIPLIGRLIGHFSTVVVRSDLGVKNTADADCSYHAFVRCGSSKPWSLTVDAQLGSDQQMIQFHNADGEVHIPSLTVGPRGTLAAIVRDSWQGGANSRPTRYSLLPCARELQI